MEKCDVVIMYFNNNDGIGNKIIRRILESEVKAKVKEAVKELLVSKEILNREDIISIDVQITKKKDIETFIKEHTYINYCEAIIFKDGRIAYVSPSHNATLIRETGKDMDTLSKEMNTMCLDIEWLVNYTGAVAVWYNGCICPDNITAEQQHSLSRLLEEHIIKSLKFS